MKIGITGTHGVGKSTLARSVATRLGISLIPESARRVREEGFTVLTEDTETTLEAELAMFGYQIVEEQKVSNFVSDRMLLDYVVYVKSLLPRFPNSMLKSMEDFTLDYVNYQYDYIFYVPIEFILPKDDFRAINIEEQKLIDSEILKELEKLRKDYKKEYYIIEGNREERTNKILRVVGG